MLDFAAPSYHSLQNAGQSQSIEMLQKKALKIIYGPEIRYKEALAISNMSTLEERRITLLKTLPFLHQKMADIKTGGSRKNLTQPTLSVSPEPTWR